MKKKYKPQHEWTVSHEITDRQGEINLVKEVISNGKYGSSILTDSLTDKFISNLNHYYSIEELLHFKGESIIKLRVYYFADKKDCDNCFSELKSANLKNSELSKFKLTKEENFDKSLHDLELEKLRKNEQV